MKNLNEPAIFWVFCIKRNSNSIFVGAARITRLTAENAYANKVVYINRCKPFIMQLMHSNALVFTSVADPGCGINGSGSIPWEIHGSVSDPIKTGSDFPEKLGSDRIRSAKKSGSGPDLNFSLPIFIVAKKGLFKILFIFHSSGLYKLINILMGTFLTKVFWTRLRSGSNETE